MDRDPDGLLSALEFFQKFPYKQSAIDFLETERWSDRVNCPRCDSLHTKRIGNQDKLNCDGCRRQFSVRTGTIFENTRIPLRKWLYAFTTVETALNGISGIQLSKELGIT